MIKCYFHPHEDAIFECSQCGKPICGDCMRYDEDNNVICPGCTLESAVDIADEDQRNYLERVHQTQKKQSQPKSQKAGSRRVLNGWFILLFLLLLGVYIYMNRYIDRAGNPVEFKTSQKLGIEDPAPEMIYILSKIYAYANDHNGKYPDKLSDIYQKYLKDKPTVLESKEEYVYSPIGTAEKFVLNLPKADRFGYRKLYISGDGVLKID